MHEANLRRVLMTGDTVGGVWTFNLELARALGDRGVEVFLAVMGGHPSEAQRAEAAAVANLRLFDSAYKLEWMQDPWDDVEASGRWMLELDREFHPDIVHLNTYGHSSVPWRTPVLLTAHSCVLSWWAAVRRDPLPAKWNRYRAEVECALQGSDMVAAPSGAMLRTLQENYGGCLPACRVIENGRCASHYRAAEKENFILTAGRLWDEAKNVAAVASIARRLPWPVYLAGEALHPGGTRFDASACHMLGKLDAETLAGWYARASIFAHPARYEPFGLSPLEAALSGCALVLGDIESLREIWGDAALFVDPDDEVSLEQALRSLVVHPSLRSEMADRAVRRAREFTADRMADGYLNAYRWLAATRRVACAS